MAFYESKCKIGDRLYSKNSNGSVEYWDVFFIGFNERYTIIRAINSNKHVISFNETDIGKRFFFLKSEIKGGDNMNEERCVMCNDIIPEGRMICKKCENLEPEFSTTKIIVCLNKISDISDFIKLTSKCKDDVVVKSGHFAVDAKSILGLYSLDLTKPVTVEFYSRVPYEVKEGMKKFIVN